MTKLNSGKIQIKWLLIILLFGIVLGFVGSIYFTNLGIIKRGEPRPAPSPAEIKGFSLSFADLVTQVSPAVVNISTTKTITFRNSFRDFYSPFEEFFGDDFLERFFGQQPQKRKQRSLGSGFILSKEGHILTNSHVIEGADEITIRLASGKTYSAEIVGRDKKTDLALIKAKSWFDLPAPVTLGDSDTLRVGDWVMAIGNPFGLDHTVTAGIVSAKGRIIGSGPYDDFIQTDASINPGNSGGPLFNTHGEVVGINSAIFTTSGGNIGIGFAVPINMAKEIIEELEKKGTITRGWIGITIQPLTPELAQEFDVKDTKGLVVTEVSPDGPADQAGLQRGDVIVEFNGRKISKDRDLSTIVSTTPPGTSVTFKIIRGGDAKTLSLTVGEMEKGEATSKSTGAPNLGIRAEELSPEAARRWGYPPSETGVIISRVEPGSIADESGLQAGDLIKEVNQTPITSTNDYHESLKKASPAKGILFFIYRETNALYVVVKE
ncbi:MAG: DegQ family serine endoprotease [Deltaproteobacteria bacterium]|nr:DegQ family serine endoprotease [Deltaproteobacteria bacterium]